MSARGDARKLLKELESLGWKVTGGSGKHYCLIPPDGGKPVSVTCSPTDSRAATNLARLARQTRRK